MSFEASIKAKEDFGRMQKLFSTEDKKLKRSAYTIKRIKGGVEFLVKADDIAALRASLNSITQILSVYKKIEENAGEKNA